MRLFALVNLFYAPYSIKISPIFLKFCTHQNETNFSQKNHYTPHQIFHPFSLSFSSSSSRLSTPTSSTLPSPFSLRLSSSQPSSSPTPRPPPSSIRSHLQLHLPPPSDFFFTLLICNSTSLLPLSSRSLTPRTTRNKTSDHHRKSKNYSHPSTSHPYCQSTIPQSETPSRSIATEATMLATTGSNRTIEIQSFSFSEREGGLCLALQGEREMKEKGIRDLVFQVGLGEKMTKKMK